MSSKDKAHRLYEYISQVYSIDLPVDRNVTKYRAELWWQADLIPSFQCKIKEFDSGNNNAEPENHIESAGGDVWLSVSKHSYDNPPDLPTILREWVDLSNNPTKSPSPKSSIIVRVLFEDDQLRSDALDEYISLWSKWRESNEGEIPSIPNILNGWIDETLPGDQSPVPIPEREIEERFAEDESRVAAFNQYINNQWNLWSARILPLFKANMLYDQLFSLHQRLSVEGDRIEIVWGHLFLAWNSGSNLTEIVYHPLILTPLNLDFDPIGRNISFSPSQTIPTRLDLDCLLNLEYPLKDELIKLARKINDSELPPNAWDHTQMRGLAANITGYLSNEPAENTNLYSDEPVSGPAITPIPAIYNAPLIFVRERARRLWVDDAKKVAEAIYKGADIQPFIRSLVADPQSKELPNPEDFADPVDINEDEGELLLPLEYNDQQREISDKLKKHFGVLVQGPPGTGKSHTISNIVSSLLASGKRILVTSQTENALRVLRDYIPSEIRCLCVSQLGNDTEAKKQLTKAVDAIGGRLAEKDSKVGEHKINNLRRELRTIREEQAVLRNRIKEWVALDSYTINIGDEIITAHQAARECSENEASNSWFPDKLSPETELPLTDLELTELCALIQNISPEDRDACLQHMPDPKLLLTPEDFSNRISHWHSLNALEGETENMRLDWEKLDAASPDEIKIAMDLIEEALQVLQGLRQPWQADILELMVVERRQNNYWHEFLKKCISVRDAAWSVYQQIQGCQIAISALHDDLEILEINAALEELNRSVENGRNPSNWLTRLGLTKPAKLLFDAVKVDGYPIITTERINVAKAKFSYDAYLKKIDTIWKQTIKTVNGPHFDLSAAMPLANIDVHINDIRCVIEWKDKFLEKIINVLSNLGCKSGNYHIQASIEEYLKILHGQRAVIEKRKLDKQFTEYYGYLLEESGKENAHVSWVEFAEAVKNLSCDKFFDIFNELLRLSGLHNKVQRLQFLSNRLKGVAPVWYSRIAERAKEVGPNALEKDWKVAWRWRRLNEWLSILHGQEGVESLQNRLERARKREREKLTELVSTLTWQRQIANVKDHHYRALVAWADAMRHYGKGTGIHASRYLRDAANAMIEAVGAVPAWIMPLHRVIQSFPAEPGIFDVIIIDEASQCDMRALTVLFRGKKVLVVGDPEQISPSNVGIDRDKVFEKMRHFISDIPYPQTFSIDNSLYEITKAIPRMNRTLLTEHFRCVPQIIEFNNRLCPSYEGKLEPLRQPNPHELLEPPIKTVFIENGFKNNNDINEPEAEALVELLVKCCQDEKYFTGGKDNRKRTIGVISLLGEKQAKYISQLIAQHLDETEREERRIICGDAYAFQGDERDIMFLSLVVVLNAQFTSLSKDADRQRFNVATSRARDQAFLFHSIRLEDIRNPECVRYKLLKWYLNPPLAEIQAGIEHLREVADSDFEIEVGKKIIEKGYKVIPQYRPFPSDSSYRIDLVIQGEKNRVAAECDGDRWHGPEKWEYDQRREAQLRRAGWNFWRISGSAFYRNKEKSLEGLWQFLDAQGVDSSLGH